jgi:K+-transporting ATPase ATPase B chain
MSRKQLALLEPTLVRQALLDAVKKLSPPCSGATR